MQYGVWFAHRNRSPLFHGLTNWLRRMRVFNDNSSKHFLPWNVPTCTRQCPIPSIFDMSEGILAFSHMEPGRKKSFIVRNIEWIALIILIVGGLIAIWRLFYPGLFSNS